MTNNARWTRGNYPFENYPLELKSETSKWFIGHWWNIKGVISSKSRIFQACENWEFPTQECHSKGQAGAWEIPIFVIWQVWAFCDSHQPTIHTHSQLCKPNEKDKLSLFAKDFTVSIFLGIAKNPMLPYCKQESLLSITSAPWMRNAPSGPAVWWKMNFEQIAKIFLLAYFFGWENRLWYLLDVFDGISNRVQNLYNGDWNQTWLYWLMYIFWCFHNLQLWAEGWLSVCVCTCV